MTTIRFKLPEIRSSDFSNPTRLTVYDLPGREIINLINDNYLPGEYSITWNSKNSSAVKYHLEYIFTAGHLSKAQEQINFLDPSNQLDPNTSNTWVVNGVIHPSYAKALMAYIDFLDVQYGM